MIVPTSEPLQLRKEPAAAASLSNAPWTARVGDRVEAPYGDKRYPGTPSFVYIHDALACSERFSDSSYRMYSITPTHAQP